MMEAVSTFETSDNFYQTTRRNIPEYSRLQDREVQSSLPYRYCTYILPLQTEIPRIGPVQTFGRKEILWCVACAMQSMLWGEDTMQWERGGNVQEKVAIGRDLRPRLLLPIGWNLTVTLSLAVNKLPQAATPGVLGGRIITRFKNVNGLATYCSKEIY
jgi:hypothetical protein